MSQINKPTAPLVTIDPDTKADLVNGEVPSEQLPSYVDDVLEFADSEHFPAEGETGKIYVALDTNYTYRWSGSAYIQVSGGGTEVIANPEMEGDEDNLEGLEVAGVKYKVPEGGSGNILVNDYPGPIEGVLGRLTVGEESYELESKINAPWLMIDSSTSHYESVINLQNVIDLLQSYFDVDESLNNVPDGEILCNFQVVEDSIPQPTQFGYAIFSVGMYYGEEEIPNEEGTPYISQIDLFDENMDSIGEFVFQPSDGIFVLNHPWAPTYVTADRAAYIESQTGEPEAVDEITDLWLPQEKRFVKFAGGGYSDNEFMDTLNYIGRGSRVMLQDGTDVPKCYYPIRNIKIYSGYIDDEHLVGSYTPTEYEELTGYPIPSFLTNEEPKLFPVENNHSYDNVRAYLINDDVHVDLVAPTAIEMEDAPRYVFTGFSIDADEDAQEIDIIIEWDQQE